MLRKPWTKLQIQTLTKYLKNDTSLNKIYADPVLSNKTQNAIRSKLHKLRQIHQIKPKVTRTPWSVKEDAILLKLGQSNQPWKIIFECCPNRSQASIKKRLSFLFQTEQKQKEKTTQIIETDDFIREALQELYKEQPFCSSFALPGDYVCEIIFCRTLVINNLLNFGLGQRGRKWIQIPTKPNFIKLEIKQLTLLKTSLKQFFYIFITQHRLVNYVEKALPNGEIKSTTNS